MYLALNRYVSVLTYVLVINNLFVDVPAMVPGVTVDDNTITIDGTIINLTLSWGEPFNNFDPIVNYTVLCSGDVTCPTNFTTTDNTTRSYTITDLTTMTNYTFSVVATNSLGNGEAGVLDYTTPGKVMTCVCMCICTYVYAYVHVDLLYSL